MAHVFRSSSLPQWFSGGDWIWMSRTLFKKDSMRDTRIPLLLILKHYWVSLLAILFTWCVTGGSSLITSWDTCSVSSTISLCECALSSKKPLELWSSYWRIKLPSSFHLIFSWTQKSTSHCFWNSLGFILPLLLIGEFWKVSLMYVYSWWPSVLLVGANHWPLYLDGTLWLSTCLRYLLCLNLLPDQIPSLFNIPGRSHLRRTFVSLTPHCP